MVALVAAVVLGVVSLARAAQPAVATAKTKTHRLQVMVDAMREDLGVTHEVSVELVPSNPLRASVEPVKGAPKGAAKTFRLSIERGFHDQLTEEEHEFGGELQGTPMRFTFQQLKVATEQFTDKLGKEDLGLFSRDNLGRAVLQ
jgi:hypothetical protein